MNGIIRHVVDLIKMTDRGAYSRRLDADLTKCIDTLTALHEGKGKATITLKIDIVSQNGLMQVTVDHDEPKLPRGPKSPPLMLWAVDGQLSTQHPNQHAMTFEGANVAPINTPPANVTSAG